MKKDENLKNLNYQTFIYNSNLKILLLTIIILFLTMYLYFKYNILLRKNSTEF